MNRTVLKVAGESGMGLVSVGNIVSKVLKGMGYYLNSDREYPSLIKGGYSNLQIDFSPEPVHALSSEVDLVISLDATGLMAYLEKIKKGGVLVHGYERHHMIKGLQEKADERGVQLVYLPARRIAYSFGGNHLMVNMVLLGLMWRILGLPIEPLEEHVKQQFAHKPKLLAIDLQCVRAGYEPLKLKTDNPKLRIELESLPEFTIPKPGPKPDTIMLDGNHAIALGAIHCGVRAYYAYPMSPSSSILMHMANHAKEFGLIVKQAEDEITAAQMAMGSMYMGTRGLVATSGGGFDLMTETVSAAGIIENPLVIIIAQRPGPGTGLPTWTCQGDLNLAIHGGHGEYARIVMACSDPTSAYEGIQHAMNLAEEFQIPIIFLTEKVIAETKVTIPPFKQNHIPIKRGLVEDEQELETLKSTDRFAFTESGVSKRWIPGSTPVGYYANGDEHKEDGSLTEEAEPSRKMIEKRLRKLDAIKKALPEPMVIGPQSAELSFVGWGSTKNVMHDAIRALESEGVSVNYLHFDYVYPLKTEKLNKFFEQNKNVHLIEGNYFGQFGNLVESEAKVEFKNRLLKYDGRPFFLEEVMNYVKNNI